MNLLLRLLVVAGAVWVAAQLVPGVSIAGGAASYAVVAVLFVVVDVLVRPVVKLLALPVVLLTLGLFLLVINAAMFGLVAALTDRLSVDGFLPAVGASLVVSVVSAGARRVLGSD